VRSALVLAVLAVLGTAGCRSLLGIDDLTLATDAGGDGRPGDDASACLGSGLISLCPAPEPSAELVIVGPQGIDTDADPRCVPLASGAQQVCVIAATAIDVAGAASLRASGKRPLVLASTSAINIKGSIDAASVLGKPPGAGGDSPLCVAGPMSGANGAGGAGGSFGGKGGRGGNNGSLPGLQVVLDHVQGGCPGSRGNGNMQAAGGAGGGAVYLIARDQIVIDGAINASGAGGDANQSGFGGTGGGGGGAGGMIGLDAPTISGGGTLFANGGGGGGGSQQLATGKPGEESPSATIPGRGGDGNGRGGDGNGLSGDGLNGLDGNAGGGGGGGGGVIYVHGTFTVSGRVSPAPRMQ
jgi:hypothetical protein